MPKSPGIYSTTIPPTIEDRETEIWISTELVFSISQPVIKAAKGNPIIKPADAPASRPTPPLPPANKGNPTNVKTTKNNVANPPFLEPKMVPQSITPKLCAVIGTPEANGKAGTNPSTAIRAANKATKTLVFSINFLFSLFHL